jgi:hypothetical protein
MNNKFIFQFVERDIISCIIHYTVVHLLILQSLIFFLILYFQWIASLPRFGQNHQQFFTIHYSFLKTIEFSPSITRPMELVSIL